jgi:hypothetical protein
MSFSKYQNQQQRNCTVLSSKLITKKKNVSCYNRRRRCCQRPIVNETVCSTIRTFCILCVFLLQVLIITPVQVIRAEDEQQNNQYGVVDDYFVDDYFIDRTNETNIDDNLTEDESSLSESNTLIPPFWYTAYTAGSYNINGNENWIKGITYCILATIVGGASKLAIRKSWLLAAEYEKNEQIKIQYYNAQEQEQEQNQYQQYTESSHPTTNNNNQQQQQHIQNVTDNYLQQSDDNIQMKPSIVEHDDNTNNTNNDTTIDPKIDTAFEYYGCTNDDIAPNYPCCEVSTSQQQQVQEQQQNSTQISNNSIFQKYQLSSSTINNNNNNNKQGSVSSLNSTGRFTCCYCWKIRWYRVLRFFAMIGVGIVNPVLCIVAMRYVSPSIGAPFAGLTMAWILLLSGPLLKEYPTFIQWIACTLIVFGEVLIALFGDHTNGQYNISNSTIITSTAFTSTGEGQQESESQNYQQQQVDDVQDEQQQPQQSQQQQFYEYYYANNPIIQSNLQLIQTVVSSEKYLTQFPFFICFFCLTQTYLISNCISSQMLLFTHNF